MSSEIKQLVHLKREPSFLDYCDKSVGYRSIGSVFELYAEISDCYSRIYLDSNYAALFSIKYFCIIFFLLGLIIFR